MGVPTISSVSPNVGPTGGRRLVAITGTNFQLPPVPPPTGPSVSVPNPSVQVLFGTELALDVAVLSTTLLHVYTPPSDPAVVSVTVRNVDQNGTVVPGETVTLNDGYTFERPNLATGPAGESDLTRLVRTLLRELKRQVIANVELTVNTDYDDDTADGANVAMLSAVPGLVLSGPFLRENRFFSENQARYRSAAAGKFSQQRPAYTVDLGFTIIGVDDNEVAFLNLMAEVVRFFNRNKMLRMLADPAVAGDFVEYEMEIDADGEPRAIGSANNSNLHAFQGQFTIKGFDIDDASMERRQVGVVQDLPAEVDGTRWPVYLGGVVDAAGQAQEDGTRVEKKDE